MISIWTHLKRYPPPVVRLLARTGGRNPKAMTDADIAVRSNLPLSTVVMIYNQPSWDHVCVKHMTQFCQACGVDFGSTASMRRINHYARAQRSGKWSYLRRSPDFNTLYLPLINETKQKTASRQSQA